MSAPRKPSQAQLIAQLAAGGQPAQPDIAEVWHTPDQVAWASFWHKQHIEHWPVRSGRFRSYIRRKLFEQAGTAAGGQAVQDGLAQLEALALFDGVTHPVFLRTASIDGIHYLDLADEEWQVVEVTPGGWRVIADPPVRFRRGTGVLPLPMPRTGGQIDDLLRFVHVSEQDARLLICWLLAALRSSGPYPLLWLRGEQGVGKSTAAAILRRVLDPNACPLRAEPREVRDLMITARHNWTVALDNLSGLPRWLSDTLCRLATGGGFAVRTMYSDDEETLFQAQRPVLLTGINDIVTAGDLLDRCLEVELPPMPDTTRRAEADLWADFQEVEGHILGGLLDALSGVLREEVEVRLSRLPRLADFAVRSVAAERVLGWPEGTFLGVLDENRRQTKAAVLDDWCIWPFVQDLVGFEGTSTELLKKINEKAGDDRTRPSDWPKRARDLSNQLKQATPEMRAAGVEVTFERLPDRSRRRVLCLRKTEGDQRPQRPQRPAEFESVDAARTLVGGLRTLADADADAGLNTSDAADAAERTFSSGRVRAWLNRYPDGWHLIDASGCEVTNDLGDEVGAFSTREAALAWAQAHDMEVIK